MSVGERMRVTFDQRKRTLKQNVLWIYRAERTEVWFSIHKANDDLREDPNFIKPTLD